MKLSVCKKFEFCYGHCLPNHKGKCKNLHGHNGILEVEVGGSYFPDMIDTGEFNYEQGMLIDFGDLKDIVNKKVVDVLDHKYLNDVLDPVFLPPTAENICHWIFLRLRPYLPNIYRVRLYETPSSYAEIKRS